MTAVAARIRPVALNLLDAIMMDNFHMLRPAAFVDFGMDGDNGQQVFEALYYPVRAGEITPEQLDAALGKGPVLTELVNAAESNPHKGIVIRTAYDDLYDDDDEEDTIICLGPVS